MERIISEKANSFAERGIEVHIITFDQKSNDNFYHFDDSIIFHHLSLTPYTDISSFCNIHRKYKYINLLKRSIIPLIHEICPNIVISTCGFELYLLPQLKKKYITIAEYHFCRESFFVKYRQTQNKFKKFLLVNFTKVKQQNFIRLIKSIDKFVVLTEEDKKAWSEIKNITHISNFTKIQDSSDIKTNYECKSVIAVGRLTELKRFDFLIDVWKILSKKFPEWRLDIVGGGHLQNSLNKKINKLELQNKITLVGLTSDVDYFYKKSSISVLTSLYEGQGITILEAMQNQLPVISVNCPCGPSDVIVHGKTGLISKNMYDKEEFAQNLSSLMINLEKRKEMGQNGYSRVVNEYNKEKIITQWITLFNNLNYSKNLG